MLLSFAYVAVQALVRLLVLRGRSDADKDLELVVLRHEVAVLRRQVKRPIFRVSERAFLAAASRALSRHRWNAFVVTPETLLRWHRRLVAGKWTRRHRRPGRPSLDPRIRDLILRLARESPRWGYVRIRGELLKLGIHVSATTVATLLRRHGLGPAPRRGPTWREFLKAQAHGAIACDFLTVETIRLKTLYVLVWIELGTRTVRLGGVTANPDSAWVSQQARNLVMDLQEERRDVRFLVHDRDAKFTVSFDDVFASEDVRVIRTPFRAPNANAVTERWIGTARAECLDWVLVFGRRHVERILRTYVRITTRQDPIEAWTF